MAEFLINLKINHISTPVRLNARVVETWAFIVVNFITAPRLRLAELCDHCILSFVRLFVYSVSVRRITHVDQTL